MTLLETQNLQKSFGGIDAVDDVNLEIESGEMVGLIGPNGAGKTTFFNCISGVEEPDGGRVVFDGTDVTDLPTEYRARQGMVRTFQRTRELTTMTVLDNVKLAAPDHAGDHTVPSLLQTEEVKHDERAVEERALELIDFFELDHLTHEYAGKLSGGQRKLLELARPLMLDPDLLMLDEPLAGVNPSLGENILEYIQELHDDGMTFVIIEHEIDSLADLVDRLLVLNNGQLIADGPPEEVLQNQEVVDAYLGT